MKRSFELFRQTFANPSEVRDTVLRNLDAVGSSMPAALSGALHLTRWWTPTSQQRSETCVWLDDVAFSSPVADATTPSDEGSIWLALACLSTEAQWNGSMTLRDTSEPNDARPTATISLAFNDMLLVDLGRHRLGWHRLPQGGRMLAMIAVVTDRGG